LGWLRRLKKNRRGHLEKTSFGPKGESLFGISNRIKIKTEKILKKRFGLTLKKLKNH